jgi:hypothetical protein
MAANPKGGAYVTIGIDTSAIKPGMDSAARLVQQGGQQIEGALQGWVGNTNAVATATEKLERQMKGFASEQRQQGRMARFYANEIASLVPAAGGAKDALQGLIGLGIEGMAGGFGFGFALEAIKLIQVGIQQIGKEAKEAFANADKTVGKVLDEWNRKVQAMRRGLAVALGGEGAGIRMDLANSLKEVDGEIKKATASLEGLMLPWNRAEAMRLLDQLKEKRREIIKNAAEVYSTEKKIAETKEVEHKVTTKTLVVDKSRTKELEAQARILQSTWDAGEFPDLGGDAALRASAAWKAEQEDAKSPMFGPGNAQGAFDFEKQLQAQAKEGFNLADAGSAIADSFAAAGAAIGGMTGNIVAQIASIVVLTLKFIGLAIAAAAASAAETPVVGWMLAAGAGVAVAASLFGLIAGLAEGGPMEGGRPYLVGERGPELVVPRNSGTVIPNHQLGGSTNITIHATDAASFERMLRNNDNALVRVLRDAGRAGRV